MIRGSGGRAATLLVDQTPWCILTAAMLGLLIPHVGARLQPVVLPLLALLVFGAGVGIEPLSLIGGRGELLTPLWIVAAQCLFLPLLARGLAVFLPRGDAATGLLVVGLAPAEVTSALAAVLAGGAAALALRLLILSLLLSSLELPLVLSRFNPGPAAVHPRDLLIELAVAIVAPLLAATVLGRLAPRLARRERPWRALSAASVVLLTFIVAGGLRRFSLSPTLLLLVMAVAAFIACSFALGALLGRASGRDPPERHSILFSTGMREFGVAAAVASSAVSVRAGAIAALYGVLMLLAAFWLSARLRNR